MPIWIATNAADSPEKITGEWQRIDPLTADQVAALPAGTPILVIWSGGNGPHRYVVTIDARGNRYAWRPDSGSRMRFYNQLDGVGRERYATRVWLTIRNATEREAQAE